MNHHITNYWVIVGFTEVRLWEAMVKSAACLCLGVVFAAHAFRPDHCLRRTMRNVALSWLTVSVNYTAVAVSLWISPVPSVARAGVSIAGMFGSIGLWFLAVVAFGFYHETAFLLAEWTRISRRAERKRRRFWSWIDQEGRRQEAQRHGAS